MSTTNKAAVCQGRLAGKRVVFILTNLDLGGCERQAFLLARHLARGEGADVQVWGWTAGEQGDLSRLCDRHGISWRVVPCRSASRSGRLAALARYLAALRRVRPDAILSYLMPPNIVCGAIWRWSGASCFIWNQRNVAHDRQGRIIERWGIRHTPAFVANSQEGADYLIEDLGAPRRRVHVIPNGVQLDPPQADRAEWRARLGLSPSCFVACMIGNLTRRKDHATLLHAWRQVLNRWPDRSASPQLVLAGAHWGGAETVNALISGLGLADTVHLPGHVADVSGLLSSVDLGVFSSRNEGCPNGVLECMAAGLAVAATDIRGVRDAIGASGADWLSPPGDASTLADRILALAIDVDGRIAAGRRNRQRVKEAFGMSQMTEAMTQLILAQMLPR